jgi:sugar lactone lactonase YvrE
MRPIPSWSIVTLAALTLVAACKKSEVETGTPAPVETGLYTYTPPEPVEVTVPVLGNGAHTPDSVEITPIVNPADGIVDPRDVTLNPQFTAVQLWVVNGDDTIVFYDNPGEDTQVPTRIADPYAWHALDNPTGIAFGFATVAGNDNYTFATCHESVNDADGTRKADNRMGPTLWLSDPEVLGVVSPNGFGSHLAQVHESPNCMGISFENATAYWVFDGNDGALVRYDFDDDEVIGDEDVAGSTIARYDAGLSRVAGVPSGVLYDGRQAAVFVSDTGNGVVKRLLTTSGKRGETLPSTDAGTDHYRVDGADVSVLIDGALHGIERPSGLDLYDDTMFVADNATGIIWAFGLDGLPIDYLDTGLGPGALRGLDVRSDTELWVVDGANDDIVRIRALE